MTADSHLFLYAGLLFAAALASGFAGGLFGIGGGVLRIPIFLYLFPLFGASPDVMMHMAAGTSLALGVPTGLRSALTHQRSGNLDAGFLRSWLPALLLGVIAGLVAMRFVPGSTLQLLFAISVLAMSAQMLFLPEGLTLTKEVPGHPGRDVVAAGIGSLSTMIGISGGAFMNPILVLLGMSLHRAVAIASASAVGIATLGAAGLAFNGWDVPGRMAWSLGYVDVVAFAVMLPGILISAPLGVRLGHRLSEKSLRRSFGLFLIVVAADMLWRLFGT